MIPFFRLALFLFAAGWLLQSCDNDTPPLTLRTDDDATTIFAGKAPLLRYVHQITPAPSGQNPLYERSAYIHPLRSPGGMVLTRIQPPDHYHHYGIWNPWTRTSFGEYKVDFWNLADGQGTVRFDKYLEKTDKRHESGFITMHEHIYFREDGSEGVAIQETWDVKVHGVEDDQYLLDLEVTLSTPLETGITLEAYRYGGGIGFRATEMWHSHNSSFLTSEGKDRAGADGTQARWVIIEGESTVPQGRSGILFLSHPTNHGHPEPLRVWPPGSQNGKENVFFVYCPIRNIEWILEPGLSYALRYRMVVFDGKMSSDAAQANWLEFSASTYSDK